LTSITGVVLSAGKGTRIDPFNAHFPKPLLPVGNRPIMGHHLQRFRELGIRRAVVVVGHLMDRIINHFGRGSDYGLQIRYVEQDRILGIAHAVGMVEAHVEGPILLCLGDIFYWAADLERMVTRYRQGDVAGVLAVKEETDPATVRRNFSVEVDGSGLALRLVEKPRSPRSLLKGCGIYVLGPEIFDAIRKTPRTALRDEYELTTSLQILIDDGLRLAVEPVVTWDLNITFPRDLLEGNLAYLRAVGAENLVDPTARVEGSVRLEGCVVGARCVLEGPRMLRHCVVLPDTRLAPGEDLVRAIVGGELVIHA
jgi:dTDP-glucose pyrophosphorylase